MFVLYEYEVAGRAYRGTRLRFGESFLGWTRSRSGTPRVGEVYEPDQEVTVFYDPARPGRCSLSRDFSAQRFQALLLVGLVFIVAGIGVLTGRIHVEG